jgi:hypothetical protein
MQSYSDACSASHMQPIQETPKSRELKVCTTAERAVRGGATIHGMSSLCTDIRAASLSWYLFLGVDSVANRRTVLTRL